MTCIRRTAFVALALLALASAGRGSADPAPIFTKTLTTLQDAAGGAAIGTVNPSIALAVKERKDGFVEVEIKGWSPAGGDRYLFKEPGIRIGEVILTEDGLKHRAVGETREDEAGGEWQSATVTGWIVERDTSPDLDSIWKAAGDIYFSHCTRCHSQRRPGDFTANQWPQALKVMTVRAGLAKDEAALVTMLLQSHGKDQNVSDAFTQAAAVKASAPTAAPATKIAGTPEMAAKGAELFKSANCFVCHGDDAKTPTVPEYPRLAGQSADYILKQITDFKAGKRANDEPAVMKDAVMPLSDDDAKAIAYWLSTN